MRPLRNPKGWLERMILVYLAGAVAARQWAFANGKEIAKAGDLDDRMFAHALLGLAQNSDIYYVNQPQRGWRVGLFHCFVVQMFGELRAKSTATTKRQNDGDRAKSGRISWLPFRACHLLMLASRPDRVWRV